MAFSLSFSGIISSIFWAPRESEENTNKRILDAWKEIINKWPINAPSQDILWQAHGSLEEIKSCFSKHGEKEMEFLAEILLREVNRRLPRLPLEDIYTSPPPSSKV